MAASGGLGALPSGAWEWCRRLGKGSFGEVFMAYRVDDATQTPLAVKTFELNSSTTAATCVALLKEVEVMRNIGMHDRIVNCYGAMYDQRGKMCIVLEFMPGGALNEFLTTNPQLSIRNCAKCIKQVLEGVAHLHKRKIYHRDLKSANVLVKLVTEDGVPLVKLADFGTSKMKAMEKSTLFASMSNNATVDKTVAFTLAGTYAWMAPEVIKVGVSQKAYSPAKADVWSFGILCCEVLQQGKIPWGVEHTAQAIFMIGNWEKDLPPNFETKHLTEECKQFLKAALKVRVNERLTADRLMVHRWMTSTMLQAENKELKNFKQPTGGKSGVTGTSQLMPVTNAKMLRDLCATADDGEVGADGEAGVPDFLQTAVWTEYEEDEEDFEDEDDDDADHVAQEEDDDEDDDGDDLLEVEDEEDESDDSSAVAARHIEVQHVDNVEGHALSDPYEICSEGESVYAEEEEEVEVRSMDSAEAFLENVIEDGPSPSSSRRISEQPFLKESFSNSSPQAKAAAAGGKLKIRDDDDDENCDPPEIPENRRMRLVSSDAAESSISALNASTYAVTSPPQRSPNNAHRASMHGSSFATSGSSGAAPSTGSVPQQRVGAQASTAPSGQRSFSASPLPPASHTGYLGGRPRQDSAPPNVQTSVGYQTKAHTPPPRTVSGGGNAQWPGSPMRMSGSLNAIPSGIAPLGKPASPAHGPPSEVSYVGPLAAPPVFQADHRRKSAASSPSSYPQPARPATGSRSPTSTSPASPVSRSPTGAAGYRTGAPTGGVERYAQVQPVPSARPMPSRERVQTIRRVFEGQEFRPDIRKKPSFSESGHI